MNRRTLQKVSLIRDEYFFSYFIGCRAKDVSGSRYINAAFTNGIITDTVNWVCTNNTNTNTTDLTWTQEGFDDSGWPLAGGGGTAYSVGCGSQQIWYHHHVINEWIFCRYKRQ